MVTVSRQVTTNNINSKSKQTKKQTTTHCDSVPYTCHWEQLGVSGRALLLASDSTPRPGRQSSVQNGQPPLKTAAATLTTRPGA